MISAWILIPPRFSYLRFATCRWAYHDDGDSSGMEQSARHGTVKLGRSHILVFRNIVNAVDKGRALAAVPGRVGRNLGRSVPR